MTELQKRFCEEYVIDYHITNAAKRAGYQGDNVKATGWQVLQLPEVQDYIEELQVEASKRCQITKDEWLNEWKSLGFSNIQDYINSDLSIKDLSTVKNPKAIKSIKKSVTEFDGGEKTVVEFALHDKPQALMNIGKHLGWYAADNEQSKAAINITIQPDESKLGE